MPATAATFTAPGPADLGPTGPGRRCPADPGRPSSGRPSAHGPAACRRVDIDRIEDVVAARAKRQVRLHGATPLRNHAVIWEAAFRQMMGGPQAMARQLQHLCQLAELPNVHIQVLPFRAGSHPCIGGPFNLLSFGEEEAVDVVHMDTPRSTVWVEDAEESEVFVNLFDQASRMSLAPYDSVEFIDSIAKEMSR